MRGHTYTGGKEFNLKTNKQNSEYKMQQMVTKFRQLKRATTLGAGKE